MDVSSRNLAIGMQGDDVRALQDELIRFRVDLPVDARRNAFLGIARASPSLSSKCGTA